jgi:putative redox protein
LGEAKRISLTWREGLQFTGGAPDGPATAIDGDNAAAPGPMLTLLLAAASCSGSDVVIILEKMRVKLHELRIDVTGTRRDEQPRRYVSMHFDYHMAGEGLDESKARRAVDLSLEKYCSVIHTLAPDIRITHAISLA